MGPAASSVAGFPGQESPPAGRSVAVPGCCGWKHSSAALLSSTMVGVAMEGMEKDGGAHKY